MSFRKRNIGLSSTSSRVPADPDAGGQAPGPRQPSSTKPALPPTQGVRPSPIDGRPTTSTGTPSLDGLLAGHAGLALGSSILIEESGTTDFAGALLRYYAAEGIVQGHQVHIVGVGEHWGRELPGLTGTATSTGDDSEASKVSQDKNSQRMKIAWRYERLGEIGAEVAGSRGFLSRNSESFSFQISCGPASAGNPSAFCHTFDLTKRLDIPKASLLHFIPVPLSSMQSSPYVGILEGLRVALTSSPESTVHRVVIPTLLSPALFPPHASLPRHALRFLHSLRHLLRLYPSQLTAMITLPLEIYPRTNGLVRWMELLSDGVLELTPFPHLTDAGPSLASSGAATVQEEQPQGIFKIHRLPVYHERGGGGQGTYGLGEDLAFTVSRRRFAIRPFSLPPVDGDAEAQESGTEGPQTKVDLDF